MNGDDVHSRGIGSTGVLRMGMVRSALRRKVDRVLEFLSISAGYVPSYRAKRVLLSCYTALLADPVDASDVRLDLAIAGVASELAMRKNDIYTLAEVLRARQYQLRSDVPAHPVIVDGGAHIGLASIWFASVYPGAQLHCFEPEPRNADLLRRNMAQLSAAHVNGAALGRASGTGLLHLAPVPAMHSLKSGTAGEKTVTVPVVALADYLESEHISRVDVLKLDVEGSELDALQGLGERIRDVSVIVGEMHESLVDEGEFYGFLESRGYRLIRREPGDEADVHIFEVARG
ncbi:MAG: FkbM family methyltransferase [Gemmatimonadaceae bacterium]